MTDFLLVDLDNGEILQRLVPGRRFEVIHGTKTLVHYVNSAGKKINNVKGARGAGIKLHKVETVKPLKLSLTFDPEALGLDGRIWTEHPTDPKADPPPFAAVPVERDDTVPEDHVAVARVTRFDAEAGVVRVTRQTRAMTSEEIAARDRARAREALSQSDQAMARVVEDLITAFAARGTPIEGDLPQRAQDLLAERQRLRGRLS